MARFKKYAKGRRIETLDKFVREIKANKFIFMNHKPVHSAFLASMHFRTVLNILNVRAKDRGFFYACDARSMNLIVRLALKIGISLKK